MLSFALNIFFAKVETASTTLRYGLLILLKYRWRKLEEEEQAMYEMVKKIIGAWPPGRGLLAPHCGASA